MEITIKVFYKTALLSRHGRAVSDGERDGGRDLASEPAGKGRPRVLDILDRMDIATILIVYILINLTIAALLAIAFRGARNRSIEAWITALLLQAAGWYLCFGRGRLPDLWSIGVSNFVLAWSFSLFLRSMDLFFNLKRPRWVYALPVAAMALILAGLLDAPAPRVALVNAVYAAQLLLVAGVVFSRRRSLTPGTRLCIFLGYAVGAGLHVGRLASILASPSLAENFLANQQHQGALILLGLIPIVTCSFGVVLMHREVAEQAMEKLAALDHLTGVLNRRSFEIVYAHEISRARRDGLGFGLAFIDIDYFKRVNDRFGHAAGDKVLIEVTRVVKSAIRDYDYLARWGGEEFCVLLPGATLSAAREAAERIRTEVESHGFRIKDKPVEITVSIGVGVYRPGRPENLETMMRSVDIAMYQAKELGRNQVVLGEEGV